MRGHTVHHAHRAPSVQLMQIVLDKGHALGTLLVDGHHTRLEVHPENVQQQGADETDGVGGQAGGQGVAGVCGREVAQDVLRPAWSRTEGRGRGWEGVGGGVENSGQARASRWVTMGQGGEKESRGTLESLIQTQPSTLRCEAASTARTGKTGHRTSAGACQ